jgi:ParB/RepB/Spo0J family partition protein
MSALTPLALQNASTLRAFRSDSDQPSKIYSLTALSQLVGRDASNLSKALKALCAAEPPLLFLESQSPIKGHLTEAGVAAVEALDRADGMAETTIPTGYVALRHDQIGPDPDNARKKSGLSPEAIAEMAESILDKGILQNPGVRENPEHDPADVASPSHLLTMGERRWRAWGLLIERGDWPAGKTILCKLSAFDDAERLEAGLIENDQRADINNLERGEQYLVLHERYGRTPQDLARKVNRTSRFIQIAMKVAKSATAEDKARYLESERAYAEGKRANIPGTKRLFTWEKLRDTVKTAKYVTVLEKRERITLLVAELARKIDADPDAVIVQVDDPDVADAEILVTLISMPPGGGHWGEAQDLGLVFDHREDGRIYGGVTSVAREWLTDAGFDADPAGWTRDLAVEALGSAMPVRLAEEAGKWITPFINAPKPPAVEPPPPPQPSPPEAPTSQAGAARDSFADQIRQVNAEAEHPGQDPSELYARLGGGHTPTPTPTSAPETNAVREQASPAKPELSPDLFVTLMEVAHKITNHGVEARGGAIRGCHVYGYHTGPHAKAAQALLHDHRMLMFVQSPNSHGFLASLTQAAWDYIDGAVDDERLEGARYDNLSTEDMLSFEASGHRYLTTWLQDPIKVAEPKPAATAAEPASPTPPVTAEDPAPLAEDDDLGSPFAEDEPELAPGDWLQGVLLDICVSATTVGGDLIRMAMTNKDDARYIIAQLADSGHYRDIKVHQDSTLLIQWGAQ